MTILVAISADLDGLQLTPSPTNSAAAAQWKIYTNDRYHFVVQCPRGWKAGTPARASDLSGLVLYLEDPAIGTNGFDVGSSIPPHFLVRVFDKRTYRHLDINAYLNLPTDEISTEQRKINVAQQITTLYRYTSSGPEAATDITQQVELTKGESVYLLQYSYTLAGCSNVPTSLRQQCSTTNRTLAKESEEAFARILASFKVLQ